MQHQSTETRSAQPPTTKSAFSTNLPILVTIQFVPLQAQIHSEQVSGVLCSARHITGRVQDESSMLFERE